MKKRLLIAATLALVIGQQAHASGVAQALVYTNLNWNFSSNAGGLQTCNNMRLDGSGNLAVSSAFVAYGVINCGSFGYGTTGSGYIGNDGTFNMTLNSASGGQMVCARLNAATMSGTCSVFNSVGAQIGTAFIGYVP